MKDVEFVAQLVLFLEHGEQSTSQADLDDAFDVRDHTWERKTTSVAQFRSAINTIKKIIDNDPENYLIRSRLKNQADFYSLFAAVCELNREGGSINYKRAARRLKDFLELVSNDSEREKKRNRQALDYFNAARSASNDSGPRRTRIKIIKSIIS